MTYLRVISKILQNSLKQLLIFRVNFILVVFSNLLWFLFTLAFFEVIFHSVHTVASWTHDEVIALLSTNQIIICLYGIFFRENLERIPNKVRDGSLDLDLTKPINQIFWLSCQRVQPINLISIILPVIILIVSLKRIDTLVIHFSAVFLYILVISGSVFIRLIFGFLVSCIAIKYIQVKAYFSLQSELFQYGSYPDTIYTGTSRFIFSFIIPIILLANLPASILLSKPIDPRSLVYYASYVVFGLVIAIIVFQRSIRQYNSGGG